MSGSGWIFREPFSFRLAFLVVLMLQAILLSPAAGAERRMIMIEGADYFGLDYETLKEVDLEDCKAACIADSRCQAFTYNTNARWCFLKSNYGDLRSFEGAVSGHIARDGATEPDLQSVRTSELGFLRSGAVDEAKALAGRIGTRASAAQGSFDAIVADARAAARSGNRERAADLYAAALKIAPESGALWLQLADSMAAAEPRAWKLRQQFRQDAVAAAVNGYLRAQTDADRAHALAVMGRALAARSEWKPAIRATRASLALVR